MSDRFIMWAVYITVVVVLFERVGYFCVDRDSIRRGELVFNRTATLRDTWAKIEQAMSAGG